MGDLSKHFNRSEFECSCGCGMDTVDSELIEVLEALRVHFGKMVHISSANRCEIHNKSIGGADKSQHKQSKASDIFIIDISPKTIYVYLDEKYPNKYGIGRYETFVHIDVRSNKARW